MADLAQQIDFLLAGIADESGIPLSGAIVVTRNSANSAAKAVWEDKDKTLPSAAGKSQFNLDSDGRAEVFADGVYTILIYAASDTGLTSPIYTFEGLSYSTFDGSQVNTMKDLIDISVKGDGDAVGIVGFFAVFPSLRFYGGGPFVWQEDLNKNLADGGMIIDPDNTGGYDGTVSTRDAFLSAQGGGVGTGCWVREDYSEVDVSWFGTVRTLGTDDYGAIQAGIGAAEVIAAAQERGGISVYAPGAEYSVESTLSVSQDYIYLRGDGKHLTAFVTTNSASAIITVGKVASEPIRHIGFEGLSFETRGNATSGATVEWINVIDGVINDVGIFGWWDGLSLVGCNRCFQSDMLFSQGGRTGGKGRHGVLLSGTDESGVSSDIHFTDIQVLDGSTGSLGYESSMNIKSSDGLYVENSHFVNGDVDVSISPDDVEKNDTISSILFSNCYFDTTSQTTGVNSVRIAGTASTAYQDIQFSNCLMRDSLGHGVQIDAVSLVSMVTFNGCVIRGHANSGLFVTNTPPEHVVISGCIFSGNNTDGGASDGDIVARGEFWNISGSNFKDGNAAGISVSLLSNLNNSILSTLNFKDSTAGTKISNTGTGNKLYSLTGFVIGNKGFATITNPATSITVAHGLDVTPSQADINVTRTTSGAGTVRFWVDNVTSTTFDLTVDATPTTSAAFNWNITADS